MAIRTYESTKGEIWEWEETPESVKALEIYWHNVELNRKQNEEV